MRPRGWRWAAGPRRASLRPSRSCQGPAERERPGGVSSAVPRARGVLRGRAGGPAVPPVPGARLRSRWDPAPGIPQRDSHRGIRHRDPAEGSSGSRGTPAGPRGGGGSAARMRPKGAVAVPRPRRGCHLLSGAAHKGLYRCCEDSSVWEVRLICSLPSHRQITPCNQKHVPGEGTSPGLKHHQDEFSVGQDPSVKISHLRICRAALFVI